MTESTTARTDRTAIAEKALAYYGSADPKTLASSDTATGESYSVLEAASGLAAALQLFVGASATEESALSIADEHFAGYPADKLPADIAWEHLAQSLRDVAVRSYRAGAAKAQSDTALTDSQMLARLGIDFREAVDDQGEDSYLLEEQHIARSEG